MRVLFIGGTGNISRSCAAEALARGMEVYLYNRGRSAHEPPAGARSIYGDYADVSATRRALEGLRFDAVAQFIAYTAADVAKDIELFEGRTAQYLFISSASVYRKPPSTPFITESSGLGNRFWQYARDKLAAEELLRAARDARGFPATVVRPSHTYSDGWIPTTFGSRDYTVAQRILDGRPIVVHGDGTSLWSLTHADDFARAFVGLIGNPDAVGESYHMTTEEILSWDQIHRILAAALGREARIVHVSSEAIARVSPERGPSLLGDKAYSMIYDNSKIRRFVPGWSCTVPFHRGIRSSLAWFDADPRRRLVKPETDREIDELLRRQEAAGA